MIQISENSSSLIPSLESGSYISLVSSQDHTLVWLVHRKIRCSNPFICLSLYSDTLPVKEGQPSPVYLTCTAGIGTCKGRKLGLLQTCRHRSESIMHVSATTVMCEHDMRLYIWRSRRSYQHYNFLIIMSYWIHRLFKLNVLNNNDEWVLVAVVKDCF